MSPTLEEDKFHIMQRILERWVDDHPEPDKKIMYIGREEFTPRDILHYFKEQVDPVAKIVNNLPTLEFIQSLGKRQY